MSQSRFEKLKRLGSGSFGEAWLVRSKHSHRQYVIKEMKMSPNLSLEESHRVNNEVTIIRSCCHLNIIKYKEFFMTNEDSFSSVISIVMEYADGGDLNQRIGHQREVIKSHFPEPQVRAWFVQICFGLQYLHKKNILHRDIKTQNIFICKNQLIKLGDFGISKTLRHENDFATTGIGTPQYLSPEICRQQPYDFKSDIWCLGCVLYEICALVPAFPGRDFERLINNIVNARFAPIPIVYSSSISDLIKLLLRPEPSRRPSVVQLVGSTVLKDDVLAYIEFIKVLTSGDGGSASSGSGNYSGPPDAMVSHKDSASSLSSSEGPQSFG